MIKNDNLLLFPRYILGRLRGINTYRKRMYTENISNLLCHVIIVIIYDLIIKNCFYIFFVIGNYSMYYKTLLLVQRYL